MNDDPVNDEIGDLVGPESSSYLDQCASAWDVSRYDALRTIVDEYSLQYPILTEDQSELTEDHGEKPLRSASELTKGVFIVLMFLFAGLSSLGFGAFFRWLSKLRIPEDKWMDFSPSGSEHLMFVAPIFPALLIGGFITKPLMKLIPYFRRELAEEERKSGSFAYGCWAIFSLIPLVVALYGSDAYGWTDSKGIHYNPVFGVGETKDYRWDQVIHVHSTTVIGRLENRKTSYRVIFNDGDSVDLMEGLGNKFKEASLKIEERIRTIPFITFSDSRQHEADR